MEVSTEISQKIRSAIKAKLMELGAYVDDELPDYIMVMVANKKSRAQMSHDLGLFLGGNTETFTGWLHGLLSKLQTITVDSGDKKKDKVKASKEKKKDRKEGKEKKSKKRSSSESKKRSSSVGDKSDSNSKQSSEIISKESNTESTTRDNEHTATKPVESVQKTSDIVIEITEQEEIPLNLDLVESDLSDKNKTESTKIKNVHEDVEDVRQLLVTVTQADELAEELETTEQEVEQSRQKAESFTKLSSTQAATQENETKKKETVTAHLVNRESLSRSPSPEKNNLSTISRKRKIPTSVVASVRRGDEEEYDPYNPAVGSVASVVKVTTRKSSVPASLQANRALLMKAMSDAEKSIAVKRKIGVTRPMSRADSPAEVYSPKRKREQSHAESSPPPYIPSRKEESSRHRTGQHADHRTVSRSESGHLLSREDRKELISRSRREELLRTIGIDRDSSHKVESLTSPERKKEAAEKVAKYERHAKDDVEAERKFQITSNVVKGSSAGDHRKERSPSPPVRKSVVPSQGTGTENKNPISERLGKIVVERRRSADYTDAREEISRSIHGSLHRDAREDIKMRSIQSSVRHDAREDIKARSKARQDLRESKSRDVKHSGARVLSQLGRDAVQKQCQAAVMSVTTSKAVDKSKHRSSPDSRVVCCDTKSVSSDDGKDVELGRRIKTEHLDEAERMGEEEPEDLAHMIGDDLEPEILEPQDEFTLDLDEDDITNVVGDIVDDVEENTAMEKPEQKLGTRFIVTLDGVDERQFDVADGSYDKFRRPLVGSSMPVLSADQQNEKLLLGILATHGRPMAQGVLQQGVLPITRSSTPPQAANKLQPPKIQPFSISLKDSDDEHEEKDHKPAPSSYEQTNVEMEAEISPIKRAKMSERCKFWPACAAGSACEYHHPTTHCKTFPNCKFGTNCLFIHPNCRYDSKCSRPDCPFTHTSRRSSMANAPRVIAIPQPHVIFSAAPQIPHYSAQSFNAAQTTCRFYPNCLNVNCAFLHPKPCRFGVACKSSSCPFYHPPLPEKSKLKWQAQISEPKESLSKVPVVDSSTNSPTIPTSLTAVSSTSQ
ncbi:zinc finger CCCH domain-containing protein 14-like [Physella acuta]|uniref:zinc finger CCCH domain-containing protein 14-like n=1 Tax=Physella acuta TaxID=109671 RepID=UPI0027DAC21F|nr:zinc finger CCCH domain-containing protein 14-like [Physella acuta]